MTDNDHYAVKCTKFFVHQAKKVAQSFVGRNDNVVPLQHEKSMHRVASPLAPRFESPRTALLTTLGAHAAGIVQ
ncbi:MAG: hypothetical protein IJQ59_08950 [Bacteroidaceae bacterium]|nr:hypothetical protein [Bacteroidaceae bacterium]